MSLPLSTDDTGDDICNCLLCGLARGTAAMGPRPLTAAEVYVENQLKTKDARIARLEGVLETTRALSDQRGHELLETKARLKVLEEFLREGNLPEG